MATACASCTLPSIGGVSVVSRHAVLTLLPGGEVPALLTHVAVDARAVSVTLASWTLDKRPLVVLLFGAQAGVKGHLVAMGSTQSHRSPRGALGAVPSPSITGIIAPATPRLLQALAAGSQPRAVLRRAGGRLPLQALSVREGDDVGVGVHAPLRAATPHTLHAIACTVGARGPQGTRLLARPCVLIWTNNRLFANKAIRHGRTRICF